VPISSRSGVVGTEAVLNNCQPDLGNQAIPASIGWVEHNGREKAEQFEQRETTLRERFAETES
jgi:hypothetical protein